MAADLPSYYVQSTAYSLCSSGTIMADGTRVRFGSVAMNTLPLGTRITVRPAFLGRVRFTVRDRIGAYSSLDFWSPSCAAAVAYGRRTVRVQVGWWVKRGRVLRVTKRLPS